jgi:hypothetical protein
MKTSETNTEEVFDIFSRLPLVRIHPTIDRERLIGHVGVDHEQHDGFNNVFWLAEPARRDVRHKFSS